MVAELDRLPPHNLEAEEAVLGSLFLDDQAISRVADVLSADDFFGIINRPIYEACLALYQRNEAINEITVAHELAQRQKLDEVGGSAHLSEIIARVPTPLHVEFYAQIVRRTAMLRRLIDAAGKIAALGYAGDPDVEVVLSQAEEYLFRLRYGQVSRDFVDMRHLMDQFLKTTEVPQKVLDERVTAVLSGFSQLDELLGGLQRSDLVILAARTTLGKSSLALNIARNASVEQGANVGIFSLEMAKEQVAQRLLACEAGVDSRRLRLGQHDRADEQRIVEATGVLADAPIYVDDSPFQTVAAMRSKARRLHHELPGGLNLIVVDYLQLLHGNGRAENRVQEVSMITRSLKALARELDVPILAISQLSRAVEMRPSHEPQLSDLRESGSIEQDADVVLLLYREDVYITREDWERQYFDQKYPEGKADVIIAKHRNGPTGRISLQFHKETTKFEDYWPEPGI